ncbi:uncharacterized protein PSFLO_02199 [Pseudozyma flocculosa]|uniref:Zn(2)-C6 fungal-type domain-containing protein n=1 Tax=Pseudozyma flocculosa TaxID=84751 RepID=A0A5C3EWY4_9BASI|nr:uncharacterized protein PSFLO_02199 [Pseudozyma flocculosa]
MLPPRAAAHTNNGFHRPATAASSSANSSTASSPSSSSHPIPAPPPAHAASSSSSSSAAPSSTANPPAAHQPPPQQQQQQRPKRTLAKRSCLQCRHKKARCELPDLTVPSSQRPVDYDKKCHRCRVLHVDCVVWDGDRKRKPKIPAQPPSPPAARPPPPPQRPTPATTTATSTQSARKRARTGPADADTDHPAFGRRTSATAATTASARDDAVDGSTNNSSSRRSDSFHHDSSNRSAAEALASLYHSPASASAASPRNTSTKVPTLFFEPENELFRDHPSPPVAQQQQQHQHASRAPSRPSSAVGTPNARSPLDPAQPQAKHHPRTPQHGRPAHAPNVTMPHTDSQQDGSTSRPGAADDGSFSAAASFSTPFKPGERLRPGLERHESAAAQASPVKRAGGPKQMLWKPLTVMLQYASSQPRFLEYLVERVTVLDAPLRAIDVTDLLDQSLCEGLEHRLRPYIAWHPHMPSLTATYLEHVRQRNKATSLLLATLALLAVRHQLPLSMDLPRKLSASIDRLGTQVLVSTPRTIHTAMAFELLIAHEPALVGVTAVGSARDQASRGGDLGGENLLAVALNLCRDLGIDKSLDRYAAAIQDLPPAQPGSVQDPSHPAQGRASGGPAPVDEARRAELQQLLGAASLWLNLRMWEGHYVFLKPVIRPVRDLSRLAEQAKILICRDELGRKIPTPSRTGAGAGMAQQQPASSSQGPSTDNDQLLRAAGRTILAHRMQNMAMFHETILDIGEALVMRSDPDGGGGQPDSEDRDGRSGSAARRADDPAEPAGDTGGGGDVDDDGAEADPTDEPPRGWEDRATRTAVQIRIKNLILAAYQKRVEIEEKRHLVMAPFAVDGLGSLPEAWSHFEALALVSMLGVFASCAMHTGRIQYAFSPHDFIDALVNDRAFNEHIAEIGKKRQAISTRVVASFGMFDRPIVVGEARGFHFGGQHAEGTVEATGVPMFLTSALVVDMCKSFVEATACVIMAYSTLLDTVDTQVLLMMQAVQRLSSFDQNRFYAPGPAAAAANGNGNGNGDQAEQAAGKRSGTSEGAGDDENDAGRRSRGSSSDHGPSELLSVCRIAAQYVTQMIEMMQKWALANTLHRRGRQPLWSRMPPQGPPSSSAAQGQDFKADRDGDAERGAPAAWSHADPAFGAQQQHQPHQQPPPLPAPPTEARTSHDGAQAASLAHLAAGYGGTHAPLQPSYSTSSGYASQAQPAFPPYAHAQQPTPPPSQQHQQQQLHHHHHHEQGLPFAVPMQHHHQQQQQPGFAGAHFGMPHEGGMQPHYQQQAGPQSQSQPHGQQQAPWPGLPTEFDYGPGLQELDSFLEWSIGGYTHDLTNALLPPDPHGPSLFGQANGGAGHGQGQGGPGASAGAGGFDSVYQGVFP